MKLKNSYILLIAIAILLVSVGSVCASEDIAADSDIGLADDGTDIILAEDGSDATQDKITTKIVSEDVKVKDTETKNINVTVNDNESNPITITAKNLTVAEGNKTIKFSYGNSKITITDKLNTGNHSLIINYLGNEIYKNSTAKVILSIYGNNTIKSADSVNVNSTKNVEIPLNITDGVENKNVTGKFSGSISYTQNNLTVSTSLTGISYKNGKVTFKYTLPDTISSSTVTLVYNDNGEKISKNITLNRIFNAKIEIINTVAEYQNGNFTFKLVDTDDANVIISGQKLSLTTTGNIRAGHSTTTDEKGIATFQTVKLYEFNNQDSSLSMKQLEVGNHLVDLSTDGAVKTTKVTTNLTIKKATINIKMDKFEEYFGTNKNVTITVTNAKNGEPVPNIVLHLYMPQTTQKDYYFGTDSNGQSKIAVNQLVGGTYDVTINNNDTKNMNKASTTGKIVIKPIEVKVSSSDNKLYYNTGATATVKVTYKNGTGVAGAIVVVQFDKDKNQTYAFQADNNGQVKFSAPLSVGKHSMYVISGDSRYTSNSVTKTITVKKASAKISAPKVTAYYKSGDAFSITVTNTKNKQPIYDAKLNVKIFISSNRYYNYVGRTGGEGKLNLIADLNPGTYKVVIENGDKKNYTAKSITTQLVIKKTKATITPKKLTAKKGENKKFKVYVKNKKTKKAVQGVKVKMKVYTGKKYKTYTVKTNSKGIAKLKVKSLKVGKHKVIVKSADKYCVAKKAKSTIKITKK